MENLFKSYLIVVVFIQFLEIKRKRFFVESYETIKRILPFKVLNVCGIFSSIHMSVTNAKLLQT